MLIKRLEFEEEPERDSKHLWKAGTFPLALVSASQTSLAYQAFPCSKLVSYVLYINKQNVQKLTFLGV